jgi:serine/threonine protein phosphatase 1
MTHPVVQRHAANTAGRDFVVGDIHGAYTQVLNAMRAVYFNPGTDRLFVVGDLVDRGPESLRALKFLQQPYVHAVRGNHEDFWLECYEDGPPQSVVVEACGRLQNMGVDWWLEAPAADRDALVARFAELPLAIELETPRGLVGLVHAEVPGGMTWQEFTEALERNDPHTVQTALWGRTRLKHDDDSGVHGVGRIFVGHTPQWNGARRLGNVYALDTGAVYGALTGDRDAGRLTMVDALFKTSSISVPEHSDFDTLVDLFTETPEPDSPFGNYVSQQG